MIEPRIRHFTVALGSLAMLACQTNGNPSKPDPHAWRQIAATIQDRTITVDDLDQRIKDDLFERATGGSEQTLYELRSQILRTMLNEIILDQAAIAANLPNNTFLQQQIDALGPPSEDETAPLYAEVEKTKLGGVNIEGLDERIKLAVNLLRKTKVQRNLRDKAGITIYLDPPRSHVAATGPSRGPDDAAITLIAFTNFHCPQCQRAEPMIQEILSQYPDQLRLVFRHLPRPAFPRAQPAAEAAVCAGAQQKFWVYHDRLFENRVGGLSDEDLDDYAVELGLDMERFRKCLSEHESQEIIDADMADAQFHGLVQAPTYYLNGIRITGPRNATVFSEMIDAELGRIALEAAKEPGS